MARITLLVIALFFLGMGSIQAQSERSKQATTTQQDQEYDLDKDPRDKRSIPPRELPAEARRDIIDNYHNPEILRVFKLVDGQKTTGYLVEVKKGPKKWTIEFDDRGNSVNKINPL